MKIVSRAIVTLAVSVLLVAAAFGQANKLQDLVGARAGQAEGDLESRGYVVTHNEQGGDAMFAYWWSPSAKKCVTVKTQDGRYVSILDSMNFDCNQNEDKGMSTGTKVGIATSAAVIIGALALAHKSHHHDDNKHYEEAKQESEYERGYRDGLYSNSYHNYNNTKEYSTGYGSGVGQRNNNTSYSSGRGGYRPHVSIADLEGARASSGESDMQSRGFRNVDGFKSGTTSYTIWWNGRTGQCVQVATWDGRYGAITEIQTHPKCQ